MEFDINSFNTKYEEEKNNADDIDLLLEDESVSIGFGGYPTNEDPPSYDVSIHNEYNELAFSQVFGMMIEDAVNVMNDISVNYGELDCITEQSFEASSHC